MNIEFNGEVLTFGWSSDWNGYEVGYPEILVVGLYVSGNLNVYINTENNEILEHWYDDEYEM